MTSHVMCPIPSPAPNRKFILPFFFHQQANNFSACFCNTYKLRFIWPGIMSIRFSTQKHACPHNMTMYMYQ